MISKQEQQQYYHALVTKDSNYDGIFFVGIQTTGVFCHATCPARKPKFENCTFFETAEEALLSGYRPCKRCNPLSYPREIPVTVQKMVESVEEYPEKRWTDRDFEAIGIHEATARRQFKKIYGMTFVQYARSRRMGLALKSIKTGSKRIDTQLDVGYESSSGFYDAFSKIMGKNPKQSKAIKKLSADWMDTVLGPMISIADDETLYLVEFVNRRGLEREIERLRVRLNAIIIPGKTKINQQISEEMSLYFDHRLAEFQTPYTLLGSDFQKSVWHLLTQIPKGQTTTYKELAIQLGRPNSVRAVGNANGANQLCILIPCHRVIQSSGNISGYGGGVERKKWLLKHEKNER